MRESFNKAQFEHALTNLPEEIDDSDLEAVYDEDVEQVREKVDVVTFAKIKGLQSQKLKLVNEYKNWRKTLWDPEHNNASEEDLEAATNFEKERATHVLEYVGPRNEKDKFVYQTYVYTDRTKTERKAIRLSKGDVIAAAEWGAWWQFDDSVDPSLKQEVMGNQVRHQIAEDFDRQLAAFGETNARIDPYKHKTYKAISERDFNVDHLPDGHISEKMLFSFLTKAMHDNIMKKYKIQSVDVFEDVEHKIDFVVICEDTTRGVGVDKEHPSHIGIQFTTNPKQETQERKKEQLRRTRENRGLKAADVDEIVIVTMPFEDIRKMFNTWRKDAEGKKRDKDMLDPRGPDALWSTAVKIEIFNRLVEGINKAESRAAG